jgi:hypothetical protein
VCCLHRIPKAVTDDIAKQYREQMKNPDLVFVTPDNEAKLVAMGLKKIKEDEAEA